MADEYEYITLDDDVFSDIIPNRQSLLIDPIQIGLCYRKYMKSIMKIKVGDDNNIVYIKDALLDYCNFILSLNGQPTVKEIKRAEVNNSSGCSYLDTHPSPTGCKVNNSIYNEKKAKVTRVLRIFLSQIFYKAKSVDNSLIRNTDDYIRFLYKALEVYCFFIGSKESNPIYADYVKELIEILNRIFESEVIINRCKPTDRGYGCARMITIVKKNSDPPINKFAILILSMTNDGTEEILDEYYEKNEHRDLIIEGGRKRSTKKSRKTAKRKGRKMTRRHRRR